MGSKIFSVGGEETGCVKGSREFKQVKINACDSLRFHLFPEGRVI